MFRAELLALRTTTATKVTAVTAAAGVLLTQLVFVYLLPALARGDVGPGVEALGDDFPAVDLGTSAAQLDALSPLGASSGGGSLGIAVIAAVLLGVTAATADFRYGGIVGAALATPRRGRIVLAKVAATGVVGLVVGAVLAVVSALTLLVTLTASGIPFAIGPLSAIGIAARGAVAVALLALIGLALGLLARNQLAAVLLALGLLLVEPILQASAQLATGSLPVWAQAMPVALAQAAIGTAGSWPPAAALIGLAGLTGLALAVAAAALDRRDL